MGQQDMEQQQRRPTRSPPPHVQQQPLVDPRTDLQQADIPTHWTMFDPLRSCVVHWCGACSLVGGGSHRTEAPPPGSSKPPFAKPRVAAGATPTKAHDDTAADAATSLTYVLVISDSCVYLLDRSAVVIRCVPVAHVVRLLLVESIAIDAKAAEQCMRGRLDVAAASLSIVGFRVDGQTTAREHDLLVGVAAGHAERICGMLLRIHWAHMGPGTQLPVDVLPVPSFAQVAAHPSAVVSVPTVADVLRGFDDAGIPPMLGLDVTVSQQWTPRVEPFRTWEQLRDMLDKKQHTLVQEESGIEGAFRRLKASLTEHMTHEEQQRWRLMVRQNEALGTEVASHRRTATIAKQLLERLVPNGARLLHDALARPAASTSASEVAWEDAPFRGTGNRLAHFGLDGGGGGDITRTPPPSASTQPCAKCRELEYLVEAHPNVDKLRILKAEEALLEMERKLSNADALMAPLRKENAELTQVLNTVMRELVHASGKQEQHAQAADGGGGYAKAFEIGVRNAIRAGEPFYRIRGPAATMSMGGDPASIDNNATAASSPSYADEISGWRLLCAEMERRHRDELKDLYHAFAMYDDLMTDTVSKALRHYHPTPDVNLAQATANILAVAKARAKDAKAQAHTFTAMAAPKEAFPPSSSGQQDGAAGTHPNALALQFGGRVAASSPPGAGRQQQYWSTLDAFDLSTLSGGRAAGGPELRTAWNEPVAPSPSSAPRHTQYIAHHHTANGSSSATTVGPFASMVRWADV